MSRKKNLSQIVENEQLEYNDPLTNEALGSPEQATVETTEEQPVEDTLLVKQTYLTEDTLPEEVKNQPVMHAAEHEEEETEEEESEVEGAEYETEEGEEYEEEGDGVEEEESEDETEEGEEDEYEEEGEGDLEEEGEYEEEGEEAGEPVRSKIGLVIDRVMASIQDADGNLDKAQIAKYAGVAVLGIYGLSRTSLLGKVIISGVVSLLAKQLLDHKATKQEEVEEEEAVAA